MNSTGNDLESNDILDFEDNTVNLDILMNADQEYWTDRLGNKKPTIDYALRMTGFTPAGFDFTTGGVLKNGDRNKCVFNQADQTWYSWSGDLPYNVIAESTPGEGWKVVNRNALTIAREALRRTYLEAGYNLVVGSFEAGGTLVNANDVLLQERTGKAYGWGGTYPKVVQAGSTPATSGGVGVGAWSDRSGSLLRDQLLASSGYTRIGTEHGLLSTILGSQSDTILVYGETTADRSDILSKRIVWLGGTLNGLAQPSVIIPRVGRIKVPNTRFDYANQFGIFQNPDLTFGITLDPKSLSKARTSTNIYYVDVDQTIAADSQNGASWSTAYSAIHKALAKIATDAVTSAVIYVNGDSNGKIYPRNKKWDSTNPTCDLHVVVTDGRDITTRGLAISSTEDDTLVWSPDSTSGVYFTTRSAAGAVTAGLQRLKPAGSLAECRANPGMCFISGTTVYANIPSGYTVSDLRVYVNEANGYFVNKTNSTWYIEGLSFHGGNVAFRANMQPINSSKLIFVNSAMRFHSGVGGTDSGNLSVFGIDSCYLFYCESSGGQYDGFNYHADLVGYTKAPNVFEYNCTAYDNGYSRSGTNNGSTAHDAATTVRVGTVAYSNDGPGIVDVGNCYTLCLGCASSDPTRANGITKSNYYFSSDSALSGFPGEAWVDSSISYDGYYDLVSSNGQLTHVRNWRGGLLVRELNGGSIDHY